MIMAARQHIVEEMPHLVISRSCTLQQLPVARSSRHVERAWVYQNPGTSPPHDHCQLGKADIIADTHSNLISWLKTMDERLFSCTMPQGVSNVVAASPPVRVSLSINRILPASISVLGPQVMKVKYGGPGISISKRWTFRCLATTSPSGE